MPPPELAAMAGTPVNLSRDWPGSMDQRDQVPSTIDVKARLPWGVNEKTLGAPMASSAATGAEPRLPPSDCQTDHAAVGPVPACRDAPRLPSGSRAKASSWPSGSAMTEGSLVTGVDPTCFGPFHGP